jgi:hypothetical protein
MFDPISLYRMGMIVSGLIFLMAIDSGDYKTVSKSLAIACILSCVFFWLEVVGVSVYREVFELLGYLRQATGGQHIAGSLGNKNHSGAFIAATSLFLPFPVAIAALLTLIKMNSIMPILTFLVGWAIKYTYEKRSLTLKIAIPGVACILALLLISGIIPHSIASGRIQGWKAFFTWYDLNLVGSGISFVTKYFPSEFLRNGRALYQLHNEPLEIYAAAGLFGLIALGIVWVTSIKQSRPEINAVLIALLFNSLGNFTFHIAPLFIVFGACYAIKIKEKSWHSL